MSVFSICLCGIRWDLIGWVEIKCVLWYIWGVQFWKLKSWGRLRTAWKLPTWEVPKSRSWSGGSGGSGFPNSRTKQKCWEVTWLGPCTKSVAQLHMCCRSWVCFGPVPDWNKRSQGCLASSVALKHCVHSPCLCCAVSLSFWSVCLVSYIGFLKLSKENQKSFGR